MTSAAHPFTAATALLSAVIVALPASAAESQTAQPCTIICAPTLAVNVAENKSHIFGSPTVRNDSSGAVSRLPSTTNLELELFVAAKTRWDRVYVFANTSWLPSAKTFANPFTEYTASQLGDDIQANELNLSLGALGDVVPAKSTHGFVAVQAYVADLMSPAARPGDRSAYTQKLDVGGVLLGYPFAGADTASAAHKSGFYVFANLDYVATGLPKAGDDVPKGRTFLTSAKPAVLVLGVGMPVAPLLQSK